MALYNEVTFADAPYIPQYVGLPLEVAQDVGDRLEDRHYSNLARMSQLELLAQQQEAQVRPADREYVREQIGSIRSALEELARSGAENATSRVYALTNKYLGDQRILHSLARMKELQQENETIGKLRAAGHTPIFNESARDRIMNAELTLEELATPYISTAEAYVDPITDMEKIWSQVNPDQFFSTLRPEEQTRLSKLINTGQISPDMDQALFFKTVTEAGISPAKIRGLLDNAFNSYQLTPSYRQQTGLVGKTPEQLRSDMFKQGLMRVFSRQSVDYERNPLANFGSEKTVPQLYSERKGGADVPQVPAFPELKGPPIEEDGSVVIDTFSGDDPNAESKEKEYREQGYDVRTRGAGDIGNLKGTVVVIDPVGKDITKSPRWNAWVNAIESTIGPAFHPTWSSLHEDEKLKYMKSKEAREDYDKFMEFRQQKMLAHDRLDPRVKMGPGEDNYRTLIGTDKNQVTDYIWGQLLSGTRKMYDKQTGEPISIVGPDGKVTDRYKKLVEGIEDVPGGFDVVGTMSSMSFRGADPNTAPELISPIEATIYDPETNTPKEVLISQPAEFISSFEGQNAIIEGQMYRKAITNAGRWTKVTPKIYQGSGQLTPLPSIDVRIPVGYQAGDDVGAELRLDGKVIPFPSIEDAIDYYKQLLQ